VSKKVVGVLALQGDFEAHGKALVRAGAEPLEVRSPDELKRVQGLIIPGGESTTMLKLLDATGLREPLLAFAETKPIFGTCAGAILIAKKVTNPLQESLGLMDIEVERNAYGRQLDSRVVKLHPDFEGGELEAVFIRAPIIRNIGAGAKVRVTYNGDPVLVEEGRHMVTTFHPELGSDDRIHRMFLDRVE
jgi:pyridoxal 5'-phosphate synthase pdxT subunit